MKVCWLVFIIAVTSYACIDGNGNSAEDEFKRLSDVLNGPVAFDFLTASTIVVSERTCLSLVELETKVKTPLMGEATVGGYVDGKQIDVRFNHINDVVVQGNYMYIADFSCVRTYDIERKSVATLAGICGRMEEPAAVPTTTPVFKGHLKLAISARDLYVLDGQKVSRVDKETGVVWTLSIGKHLSQGFPSSIEVDKYSNTLFVAVAKPSQVDVVAIDIASGRQSLHKSINTTSNVSTDITRAIAGLDVAPDGTIFVVEPHSLHSIDRKNRQVTSVQLENFGYHEVAVSSKYLVISQEFYSRMYRLHLKNFNIHSPKSPVSDNTGSNSPAVAATGKDKGKLSLDILESRTFYLAIVFPSILFLLVIVVTICAARKVMKSRTDRRYSRPSSDVSSEKYFIQQEGHQEGSYWM